jgi:hypothetical protein
MNRRQHPAIAAANEFARNVMGDARILRRELKDDDISRAALEETARFLGQLAQTWRAVPPPRRNQNSRAAPSPTCCRSNSNPQQPRRLLPKMTAKQPRCWPD